jgi:hypothetical protein
VRAVLNQVILFFKRMTIQNNLAENKNSVVEHRVWRSGPKDLIGFEKRLRTFIYFLNNPQELKNLYIDHRFRGDLMYSELKSSIYGEICFKMFEYELKLTKMEVYN